MADVDLAAIRARGADRGCRTIAAFQAGLREEPLDQADEDVAALLALVDEQAARIAALEAQQADVSESFAVEFHAYGGWHMSVAKYPTLDAAMDRVRDSQKRYPERAYRIWRRAVSEAVVWTTETPGPEKPPESSVVAVSPLAPDRPLSPA